MRRNRKEIEKVIFSLTDSHKDQIIKNVLFKNMSEQDVFKEYLQAKSEDSRNMDDYYTARDAAKYLNGDLEISELGVTIREKPNNNNDFIMMSVKDYQELMQKIDRIERRLGIRGSIGREPRKYISDSTDSPKDLMSQVDVCRMLGCGKSTIKRWADKGLITGYMKKTRVLYSKKELMNSQVVKEYIETYNKDNNG